MYLLPLYTLKTYCIASLKHVPLSCFINKLQIYAVCSQNLRSTFEDSACKINNYNTIFYVLKSACSFHNENAPPPVWLASNNSLGESFNAFITCACVVKCKLKEKLHFNGVSREGSIVSSCRRLWHQTAIFPECGTQALLHHICIQWKVHAIFQYNQCAIQEASFAEFSPCFHILNWI
jgi:hypothetical protein